MLSAIGFPQPTLSIFIDEGMIYLNRPSESLLPSTSDLEPSEDPSIWGVITLTLPKARTLRNLTVRLL